MNPQASNSTKKKRLIVGISGASGVIYGIRLLEVLRLHPAVETHLVMSTATKRTTPLETDYSVEDIDAVAHCCYRVNDIAAAISSGSFKTAGMVVLPCSMKTLSGIANSYSDNLLLRAADVVLKERRKLVLVVRETPLHLGHLRLMTQVTEMGAIIMPPVPAFYHRPLTLDDIINQTVNRVLDLFDIELEHELFQRWSGPVTHGESNHLIRYQGLATPNEKKTRVKHWELSRGKAEGPQASLCETLGGMPRIIAGPRSR